MYGIAMDSSDNTYVVGGYSSSLGYNGNAQIGSYDCTISKYDAAGNGIRHKTAGNNNNDWFNRVTVDTAGNVYAVGISVVDGSKTFGGASYHGQRDGVVQGYSSIGTEVMKPWILPTTCFTSLDGLNLVPSMGILTLLPLVMVLLLSR